MIVNMLVFKKKFVIYIKDNNFIDAVTITLLILSFGLYYGKLNISHLIKYLFNIMIIIIYLILQNFKKISIVKEKLFYPLIIKI